jgi:Flp pilus assembly protein TadG
MTLINKSSLNSFRKHENGTAFAEAAIVLPLLLLMLGAAAEIGRFMYYYNTLDKATRASARYISTRELDSAKSSVNLNAAKNLAIYGNITGTGAKVLPDANLTTSNVTITPTTGTPETVTVSITGYAYVPIFAIGPLQSLAINISPSTTMRYLMNTPIV